MYYLKSEGIRIGNVRDLGCLLMMFHDAINISFPAVGDGRTFGTVCIG